MSKINKPILFKLFIMLIILMSISAYFCNGSLNGDGNFYNLILLQTNTENILGIILTLVFLVLIIDINVESSKTGIVKEIIKKVCSVSGVFWIVFISANLIVYTILMPNPNFTNYYSGNFELAQKNMTVLKVALLSLLFVYLRFIFVSLIVLLFNTYSKNNLWGYWAVMLLGVFEWQIFNNFYVIKRLIFLPMVHSMIINYDFAPSSITGIMRVPYWSSILYWFFLISSLVFAVTKIKKRRMAK